MKIEKGTIVSVLNGGLAEVKVGPHTENSFYEGAPFAPEITIKALNPIGAAAGQHVRFLVDDRNIVMSSFICFIMPLLLAAAGAFFGDLAVGDMLALGVSRGAAVGALIGLVAGVFGIKLFERSLSGKDEYKARIVEILPEGYESPEPQRPEL